MSSHLTGIIFTIINITNITISIIITFIWNEVGYFSLGNTKYVQEPVLGTGDAEMQRYMLPWRLHHHESSG